MGPGVTAIATCRVKPEPDPDELPLTEALARRGVPVEVLAWDDPDARWGDVTLCVLRSTWNYVHHLSAFSSWIDERAARGALANPSAVVHANVHKAYLSRLAERGVPVVPTTFVARGSSPSLDTLLDAEGHRDFVIKPAVSAASFMTRRFRRDELAAAAAHLAEITADRDAMVQPYVASVDDYGERAVVAIDGALTHAIRKTPRFAGADEQVGAALPIAEDEREVALRALAAAEAEIPEAGRLLYARVDLARGPDGTPRVMELELVEPSLFLVQHPPALERLADAIAERHRAALVALTPA